MRASCSRSFWTSEAYLSEWLVNWDAGNPVTGGVMLLEPKDYQRDPLKPEHYIDQKGIVDMIGFEAAAKGEESGGPKGSISQQYYKLYADTIRKLMFEIEGNYIYAMKFAITKQRLIARNTRSPCQRDPEPNCSGMAAIISIPCNVLRIAPRSLCSTYMG